MEFWRCDSFIIELEEERVNPEARGETGEFAIRCQKPRQPGRRASSELHADTPYARESANYLRTEDDFDATALCAGGFHAADSGPCGEVLGTEMTGFSRRGRADFGAGGLAEMITTATK